ncbi:MAG: imidazole glycerol phosphate synthase subunit HisH [Planctomycetota bacterium]|nr:imidazole glycerol phosphate synthase subunit HisH [Planctomycetota bacterium]
MSPPKVSIIRTGTANTASVLNAFTKLGATPELTSDPKEVIEAQYVVLPGVGSFGAAMEELVANDLVDPIVQRANSGKPLLAICVGLQVLCTSSEESPKSIGLGIVDASITRFKNELPIPQLGWNTIEIKSGCNAARAYLTPGEAYFANSYRLECVPPGFNVAMSCYGSPFVAGFERNGLLACQFHPELSGRWGLELLESWLCQSGAMSC